VDENLAALLDVGSTVLNGEIPPRLAKDACQFMAACVELKQAIDIGPSFETRLPLTFDGSCSGLQHLCAITRAPEGRLVNLTAEDDAQDFYMLVANRVWDNSPACREIMESRDDRKLVKRPVMTYFYGSRVGGTFKRKTDDGWTTVGATKQIQEVLEERGQSTKGAKILAKEIQNAIRALVPAAEDVKEFLKDLVKLCNKHNKSLRWTSPLGLPVLNVYQKPDVRTIKTRLGARVKHTNIVVGDSDELKKRKAINAVCANYVHVDSSHLQMTAYMAAQEEIQMACVHDSFLLHGAGCCAVQRDYSRPLRCPAYPLLFAAQHLDIRRTRPENPSLRAEPNQNATAAAVG
jgi:DNA-directed RNA polymerase